MCRKVEQVAEEVDSLRESLDKYILRNQKRLTEARERAELLQRFVCGPPLVSKVLIFLYTEVHYSFLESILML